MLCCFPLPLTFLLFREICLIVPPFLSQEKLKILIFSIVYCLSLVRSYHSLCFEVICMAPFMSITLFKLITYNVKHLLKLGIWLM